jgi:hypothetical protein
VFSKMIELSDRIGGRISGGKVEAVDKSTMPLEAGVVVPGGQMGEELALGTLVTKRFEGAAALEAIALSRRAAPIDPPARRSSPDNRRSLDDRLRRLGVRMADR